MCHMYMTDFAYEGPIFLVPLSPSYPSLHVCDKLNKLPSGSQLLFESSLTLRLNHIVPSAYQPQHSDIIKGQQVKSFISPDIV